MIVNLAVDHLMATPPASAEEVWNATREHAQVYTQAARRIGLTPSEYAEFRSKLLDGKAVYVKLPRKVDSMAGNHGGHVYAVRNAVMTSRVMGWRINLSDGNTVYVPQTCGNLSLLRPPVVARVAPVHHGRPAVYTPAVAAVPVPETPVAVVAPEAAPAPVAAAPVAAAPVAVAPVTAPAAAGGHFSPFLLFIPAAIGGIIAGTSHGSPSAPTCSAGSNASGVCSR